MGSFSRSNDGGRNNQKASLLERDPTWKEKTLVQLGIMAICACAMTLLIWKRNFWALVVLAPLGVAFLFAAASLLHVCGRQKPMHPLLHCIVAFLLFFFLLGMTGALIMQIVAGFMGKSRVQSRSIGNGASWQYIAGTILTGLVTLLEFMMFIWAIFDSRHRYGHKRNTQSRRKQEAALEAQAYDNDIRRKNEAAAAAAAAAVYEEERRRKVGFPVEVDLREEERRRRMNDAPPATYQQQQQQQPVAAHTQSVPQETVRVQL